MLNAALAVMRWKKIDGLLPTTWGRSLFSAYMIDADSLLNGERP